MGLVQEQVKEQVAFEPAWTVKNYDIGEKSLFCLGGTSWRGRAKWRVNFNQSGVLTMLVSWVSESSLICPHPGRLNGAKANCKIHKDLQGFSCGFVQTPLEAPKRFGTLGPFYTSSITQVHRLKPRLRSLP